MNDQSVDLNGRMVKVNFDTHDRIGIEKTMNTYSLADVFCPALTRDISYAKDFISDVFRRIKTVWNDYSVKIIKLIVFDCWHHISSLVGILWILEQDASVSFLSTRRLQIWRYQYYSFYEK